MLQARLLSQEGNAIGDSTYATKLHIISSFLCFRHRLSYCLSTIPLQRKLGTHLERKTKTYCFFLNGKICFFRLTPKLEQYCLNCISATLGQNYQ